MTTNDIDFKETLVDVCRRGLIELPKDNEHATRWCWGRKFDDGKVGYVQILYYFDGSVKYTEFTDPKLENGSYTERSVYRFDNMESLIDYLA